MFDSKCNYEQHLNRKIPCTQKAALPCGHCDATFTHASSLCRHRKTCAKAVESRRIKELEAKVAELELQCAGQSTSTSTSNNGDHNINNNTNVHGDYHNNVTVNVTLPHPNEFGRESVEHLVNLRFAELKVLLGLEPNEDTIANMVKAIHTRPDTPQNHNILLESVDADSAFVFNHRSWREQERKSLLNDCACDGAVKMLDIEHIYADKLSRAAVTALDKYRDEVEGIGRGASEAFLKPIYDAIASVLVEFTKTQGDLLKVAKEAAQTAPTPRSSMAKVFSEWKPGGVRYETSLAAIRS